MDKINSRTKKFVGIGSANGVLFLLLALLIHVKYRQTPVPIIDSFLQQWAGHLQRSEILFTISRVIDSSLILLTKLLAIVSSAVFLFTKEKLAVVYLIMVLLFSVSAGNLWKIIVGRSRPENYRLSEFMNETGKSFPSGHVIFIVALLGCIFLLVALKIKSKLYKQILGFGTLLIIVMTMFSRILLGVYYPSDTLGSVLFIVSVLCLTLPIFLKYDRPIE